MCFFFMSERTKAGVARARDEGNTSADRLGTPTGERLTSTWKGVIAVGRFDFEGGGMDIPYNTLLAAKARRSKKN